MAKTCGSGLFNFSPFSSSPSPSPSSSPAVGGSADPQSSAPKDEAPTTPRVRNDNPRTTLSGFDPEALERGAKALREIAASSQAKKAFELMKKQEETRQTELASKTAEFKAMQAQAEIVSFALPLLSKCFYDTLSEHFF